MRDFSNNKFVKLFFFGNYFYGLCAITLSIESALQQYYPLNGWIYYLLAFSATVVYYTKAYILTEVSEDLNNIRSLWYVRNKRWMQINQIIFSCVILLCAGYFAMQRWQNILALNWMEWTLLFVFPIVSILYYGVNSSFFGKITLRNIGWLKPFIIGFTWAGLVTIYPALYYCLDHDLHYDPTWTGAFLFIKNFMFITVLCILFDIKDYAMDYNAQLKTLVVKLGLRATIFYLILPLCIVGLCSFILYALARDFSELKILINTIPFILIIIASYSMSARRSIFYYLIIIDGLMFVKALCGIIAMRFF